MLLLKNVLLEMFCLKKTLFGNSDAYIRERSMSSLPENLQVQFNNKNGVFLRRIILSLLLGLLQLSSPSPHCCYSLHPFLALLRSVSLSLSHSCFSAHKFIMFEWFSSICMLIWILQFWLLNYFLCFYESPEFFQLGYAFKPLVICCLIVFPLWSFFSLDFFCVIFVGWFLAWKLVLVHVPLVQEIFGLRKKVMKPKPPGRGRITRFYNRINAQNAPSEGKFQ